MTVYVELRSDSQLLSSVGGCKSVTILVCTGCANNSIAYQKSLPAEKIVVKRKRGPTHLTDRKVRRPFAIVSEAKRIRDLLQRNAINARIVSWKWPCTISSDALAKLTGEKFSDKELAKSCKGSDCVLTLACAEGAIGAKSVLGEKIMVVPGMTTVGRATLFLTLDKTKRFTTIDKGKSVVIPSKRR